MFEEHLVLVHKTESFKLEILSIELLLFAVFFTFQQINKDMTFFPLPIISHLGLACNQFASPPLFRLEIKSFTAFSAFG